MSSHRKRSSRTWSVGSRSSLGAKSAVGSTACHQSHPIGFARRCTLLCLGTIQASRSHSTLSERGRVVPELGQEEIRELLLGRYRLVYEVLPDKVAVVRVVHASRDFLRAWRGVHR